MTVYVHYKVPLVAEVDAESGEVLSVHLDDEAVEGPLTVTADGGDPSAEVRRRARQIAESAVWPGWEAGW